MAVPDSEACAQALGWKVRIAAVALAVASAALSNVGLKWLYSRGWIAKKRKTDRSSEISFGDGYPALIGGTKMIELKSLSEATGCLILGKAEFMNPGGSSKDRVAKALVEEAEQAGLLKPGGTIVEGTSGSTGISLSLIARAKGYKCIIVMPDDQAKEKQELLRQFGAQVELVRPASIVNSRHYCNVAAKRAEEIEGAFFADQFENLANYRTHYQTTAPEIWRQTKGRVDAFVMSAGTGGTISGISRYLKEKNMAIKVILVDPPGSSLYNKAERKIKRHRYDTITEGVGIDRLTANFQEAQIDDACRVSDKETVEMAHYLLKKEGLFLGSSSALNCVGAVRAARALGPGHVIVTVLCDGGQRHLTKFWNLDYLRQWDLLPMAEGLEFISEEK